MNESKFSPVFNLQGAPHLARDSRGSLEVFNPDRFSQQRPEKEEQSFLQRPEFPKEHTPRSVLNTLDLEVGSSWRLHEFSHESSHPGKQPENPSDEHHAAPENTAVYEWGQVLKSDSTTVAGVRGSGDSAGNWRASAASSSDMGENPQIPRVSEDLKDALSSFQQTFVVCDALMQDFPILYASAGFFNMTGYTAKEVIGRNCRFLQGAETDPADVAKIREALQQSKSFCGRLLNYKKDGTPFWNLLTIAPIKDEDGKLLKYIGMLVEVSQFTEGTKDKAVRPNGMPESLIKYDARQKEKVVSSVSELVEAFKENRKSSTDGRRASVGKLSNVPESSPSRTMKKTRRSSSFLSFLRSHEKASPKVDTPLKSSDEFLETIADLKRKKEIRRGIDLATTLERIEKNFVITDPRLPDNPIIFASDSFLELTEYSREEILGRNCRFLQGPDTDRDTVQKIRDAIREQRSITVQLLNYTKRGKPFWNLFHLQPMRDHKGELQYFIGVQLDGSQHFDNVRNGLPEKIEQDGVQVIHSTAGNVDTAVRELPDANQDIHELWSKYSKLVRPKPHKVNAASWAAIDKVLKTDGYLSLKHFRPVKCLGSGDTGGVHLVELRETGHYFAMKTMEKSIMLNRNKVHRTLMERDILDMMDHPFLPTLYGSFETESHICLITDFCPGGELFVLLDMQPSKIFNENAVRFYAAEVVVALEYLHCKGVVYRDLKPENILLQRNGHLLLTDFDLSFMSFSRAELVTVRSSEGKKKKKKPKEEPLAPKLVAKPLTRSNSFVGTEEYIAPEVIKGIGHSSAVDWWALGILLYEMLYGYTPFLGKNRQKTFRNILNKELTFPNSIQVSSAAKHLISGLLEKDPAARLGSSTGANELREHRFFYGVYWPLIRCQRTPDLASPISLINETATEEEAFSVF